MNESINQSINPSISSSQKNLMTMFQIINLALFSMWFWCPLGGSFFLHHNPRNVSPNYYAASLSKEQDISPDTRPHEQRAEGPRLARRMNHGFRYLYRQHDEKLETMTSFEYLSQFFPNDTILKMNASFPPLLELNVSRHLHPKMRFLQETMGLTDISEVSIPPQYFGARLERTVAPRHAFLVYKGLLPHRAFIDNPNMWQDFLTSCRTTKRFCALCNQWREKDSPLITSKQVEAFDTIFGRGALAASRDDLCQFNNTWPLEHINITSAEVLRLLIQHGANPLERDNRGVSLLHWAAGTGNLEAVKALVEFFPKGVLVQTERDGATPLHWAVAGANSKAFGTGGHVKICRYLLSQHDPKILVNQLTYDGNSPLMWASWSGTLETVKLMIRNRADGMVANRNGCTCAHWTASGGSLEICKYLKTTVDVDFFQPNHGGNTPLTHAVAFGRVEIVKWLREQASGDDDDVAASLAEDFYTWTDGNIKRKQVLQLFRDDYWDPLTEDEAVLEFDEF
jgi:ankyrin repeat protein